MLLYSWEYANNLAFREDGNQIEPTMELHLCNYTNRPLQWHSIEQTIAMRC